MAWPTMRCYAVPAHRCLRCAVPQAQFLQHHLRSPLKTGARAKLQACLRCSSEGLSEIICLERPHRMQEYRLGSAYFLSHLMSVLTVTLPQCSILLMCFCKASWKILALFYAVLDSLEWNCLSKLPRPFSFY